MATTAQRIGGQAAERRSQGRFPFEGELEYEGTFARQAARGTGRIVNISKSGLLFHADTAIAPGMELSICAPWPTRLGGANLELVIAGRAVRTGSEGTAVRILRYDFRFQRRNGSNS
jgi:hypothetical protein